MSTDDDRTDSQLRQYINHLLIEMHESQRQLIQARFVGHGDSHELRSNLQSEIVSVYWTLRPYRNRAGNSWNTVTLFESQDGPVEGLDKIAQWDQMEESYTVASEDFSSKEQTVTEPKILPRRVLVPTATAISEVADRIGFNAADPNMDDMDENPF